LAGHKIAGAVYLLAIKRAGAYGYGVGLGLQGAGTYGYGVGLGLQGAGAYGYGVGLGLQGAGAYGYGGGLGLQRAGAYGYSRVGYLPVTYLGGQICLQGAGAYGYGVGLRLQRGGAGCYRSNVKSKLAGGYVYAVQARIQQHKIIIVLCAPGSYFILNVQIRKP